MLVYDCPLDYRQTSRCLGLIQSHPIQSRARTNPIRNPIRKNQAVDVHARDLPVEGACAAGRDVSARELLRDSDPAGVPQHQMQGDIQLQGRDRPQTGQPPRVAGALVAF